MKTKKSILSPKISLFHILLSYSIFINTSGFKNLIKSNQSNYHIDQTSVLCYCCNIWIRWSSFTSNITSSVRACLNLIFNLCGIIRSTFFSISCVSLTSSINRLSQVNHIHLCIRNLGKVGLISASLWFTFSMCYGN